MLRRVGSTRPLTTKELHAAVVKGGMQLNDRDTLFRSMYRNEQIAHVGKALWALRSGIQVETRKAAIRRRALSTTKRGRVNLTAA